MSIQLPWSTSNEDLVELFTTIGKVERAEIQYEPGGRSRGTGVVEFDGTENAETAICMFEVFIWLTVMLIARSEIHRLHVRRSSSRVELRQIRKRERQRSHGRTGSNRWHDSRPDDVNHLIGGNNNCRHVALTTYWLRYVQ